MFRAGWCLKLAVMPHAYTHHSRWYKLAVIGFSWNRLAMMTFYSRFTHNRL